jgi:hypothetical protein
MSQAINVIKKYYFGEKKIYKLIMSLFPSFRSRQELSDQNGFLKDILDIF